LRGHYIDAPTLTERSAAIATVSVETVALKKYSSESFATYFDRIKRQRQRDHAVAARKGRASNDDKK
jgi:hypothetical protein